MFLAALLLYSTITIAVAQPLWFNSHQFELDGFEINRGYFGSLNTKEDCVQYNEANCIYSNFINPPNILFVPNETNSFTSSFSLSRDEAIVIAGFAPPLAHYFTITPYVANIDHEPIYASISNHSLHLNSTWFVAIMSGDLHTIDLINDWFRDANTSLTTSIYNHYIYNLPIVHDDNDNIEYSVIIRHQTTKQNEEELQLIYSQAPTLLSWRIKALNFNETESEIVTVLDQIKKAPETNEYDLDIFLPKKHRKSKKHYDSKKHEKSKKHHKSSYTRIDQDAFYVDNYESAECISSLRDCNFDEPESILFKSPVFTIGHKSDDTKLIFVTGINHINTNNAIYSTVNIVDDMDNSIIAQIALNDIENDLHYYVVMFVNDCSSDNYKWYTKYVMYCQEVDQDTLLNTERLRITEMLSSSNNYGIAIEYIQPPYVYIQREIYDMSYSVSSGWSSSSGGPSNKVHSVAEELKYTKPNIILIMLDDLGWRDVGYNGAEYSTSNIDQLATTGLILNNWYVHPVCTPTRTALYTGRYAFRYNLTIPVGIGQRRYIPHDADVLQEVLSSNGYETHLVGKWHVGNSHWKFLPLKRGFDTFYGFTLGWIDYYSHLQTWDDWSGTPLPRISGDNNLRLLNAFFPEGLSVYDLFEDRKLIFNNDYLDQLLSDRVVDIINSKTDDSDPFYMIFSMTTPHTPIVDPPQRFSECNISLEIHGEGRYNYCNMMQIGDRAIGDIITALKNNDLWENTIVIVTSDNGGISNRSPGHIIFGSYGSNAPLRGLKSSPFEGGNRVIGFINGGYITKYNLNGTINNKMYHIVDLYETIINGIADIGIDFSDKYLDSSNVWDSIINDDVSSPRNEWVWTVNFGASPTAIRLNDWKYVSGAALGTNDGYWDVNNVTFAPGQQEGETEYLFNITYDEVEYYDIKDDEEDIVEYLKERLQEIEEEGFATSNSIYETEGLVIAMLNGVALPYLDLTQEIKIEP